MKNKILFVLSLLLVSCLKIDLKSARERGKEWAEEHHISVRVVVCHQVNSIHKAQCEVMEQETNRIVPLWCDEKSCFLRMN